MIYCSSRSSIIKQEKNETRILPLYVSQRPDYKTLDQAINLLGRNLRNILSALERIKERQGYGRIAPTGSNSQEMSAQAEQEPHFDNKIMQFLYRIVEF